MLEVLVYQTMYAIRGIALVDFAPNVQQLTPEPVAPRTNFALRDSALDTFVRQSATVATPVRPTMPTSLENVMLVSV